MTMMRWMGWTAAAALALTVTATAGFACDQHAQAAAGTDAKAGATGGDAKGCAMPCCAKKAAAEAKHEVKAAPAVAANEGAAKCDKPCDAGKTADGKSCPKKTAVAKAEPAKDSPKAVPAPDSGASR